MKTPKISTLARFDHVSVEGINRQQMEVMVEIMQKALANDKAASFGVQLANGQFKVMQKTASGSHLGTTVHVGDDAQLCEFGC